VVGGGEQSPGHPTPGNEAEFLKHKAQIQFAVILLDLLHQHWYQHSCSVNIQTGLQYKYEGDRVSLK
jgi:hypothetical protein